MNENMADEITLRDMIYRIRNYVLYIRSKWVILLVITLIGALIGVIMAFGEKATYKATLSFALDEEKSSSGGGLSVLASQFGFDAGSAAGGAFTSQNLMALMKSRTVVERTLLRSVTYNRENMSLMELYLRVYNIKDNWSTNPAMKNVTFPIGLKRESMDRVRDSIMGNTFNRLISPKSNMLSITQRDKKTSIFHIEVNSVNELFAKLFAESLAQEISDFYAETKSQKSKLNLDILQKQTDSVRAELYSALSGVAASNDNTYNLNPAYNIMRVPSSKRQIDVQANTAMLTQLVQNLELAKVTVRKETPLLQVIDQPILPLPIYAASKKSYAITGAILGGIAALILLSLGRLYKKYM